MSLKKDLFVFWRVVLRRSQVFLLLPFLILLFSNKVQAADGSLHYEGDLKDTLGTPLTGVYLLRFVIYIDNNTSCEVYRGDYNPSVTSGKFQVKIGSSTNRLSETIAMGYSLRQVMSNSVSSTFGTACSVVANSTRTLKIYIDEDGSNTFNGSELATPIASMELGSASNAMESDMLQGKTKSDFAQINSGANLTQGNLENVFTGANYASLISLISGTSNLYTHSSSGGGTRLQVSTAGTPVSSPVAGSVWFDDVTDTVKYYDGATTQTLSTGSSGLTSVGLSLPAMFNVAGSPLTANGAISATLANQSANMVFSGPSTGVPAAPTFRALVENDLPTISTAGKVSGSAISTGTIGGNTVISTTGTITSGNQNITGTITASGDIISSNGDLIVSGVGKKVSASTGLFRQADLLDSGSNKITLKSPVTVPSNYTFTLPANSGANGYILQTDGSGVTSWVAAPSSSPVGSSLNQGFVWVGNGSNQAVAVDVVGDVDLASTGTMTIQNNAITSAKISDGSITSSKIIDGNVTTVKIADANITTSKIADGSISTSKMFAPVANKMRIVSVSGVVGETVAPLVCAGSTPFLKYNVVNSEWDCVSLTMGDMPGGLGTGDFLKDGSVAMTGALKMGGNAIYGNSTASGSLTLESTSNATKGPVVIQPNGGAVGVGTTTPSSSALLDLNSTSKGFLVPRMPAAQRDAIVSPATGLQVYNTDSNVLNYYNGVSWSALGDFSKDGSQAMTGSLKMGGFAIYGNSTASGNLTIDSTSNATKGRISIQPTGGSVGIGITIPDGSALVDMTSNSKGLLIPRMTTAQRAAISSPAQGLQIYNTTTNLFEYYNGTGWTSLASGSFNVAGSTLNSGNIWVGNASNVAAAVNLSGDVAISNTGVATIQNSAITTAKIANNSINALKIFPSTLANINRLVAVGGPTGQDMIPMECGDDEVLVYYFGTGWTCIDKYSWLEYDVFVKEGNYFGTTARFGTRDSFPLVLKTNDTDQMVIDENGKVGVGITNPTSKFHVRSSVSNTTGNSTASFVNMTVVPPTSSTHTGSIVGSESNVQVSAGGSYSMNAVTATKNILTSLTVQPISMAIGVDTFVNLNNASSTITNAIGTNTRTQASNGNINYAFGSQIDVGTAVGATIGTAYGIKLGISNSGIMTNSYGIFIDNPVVGSNHYAIYSNAGKNFFNGNSGFGTVSPSERVHIMGNLRVQGTTDCILGNGSGGTSCSSDRRLKDQIQPIENAIEKFLALRGVHFVWNEKSLSPGTPAIGVIAQEVENQFPEAVKTDQETGYKRVDYGVLISPAIEAIRYLKNQNDVLEERLKQLEQKQQEDREKLQLILQKLENK